MPGPFTKVGGGGCRAAWRPMGAPLAQRTRSVKRRRWGDEPADCITSPRPSHTSVDGLSLPLGNKHPGFRQEHLAGIAPVCASLPLRSPHGQSAPRIPAQSALRPPVRSTPTPRWTWSSLLVLTLKIRHAAPPLPPAPREEAGWGVGKTSAEPASEEKCPIRALVTKAEFSLVLSTPADPGMPAPARYTHTHCSHFCELPRMPNDHARPCQLLRLSNKPAETLFFDEITVHHPLLPYFNTHTLTLS